MLARVLLSKTKIWFDVIVLPRSRLLYLRLIQRMCASTDFLTRSDLSQIAPKYMRAKVLLSSSRMHKGKKISSASMGMTCPLQMKCKEGSSVISVYILSAMLLYTHHVIAFFFIQPYVYASFIHKYFPV